MNKNELAKEIANYTGFKTSDVIKMIEAGTTICEQKLADGEPIRLVGFGALIPEHKESRNGTNPKTQEKIIITERNSVKFKPGKDLKKIINK